MNDVERVVERFEANPGVFYSLSCSEQIVIALVYKRPELLPKSYSTHSDAVARLGDNWCHQLKSLEAVRSFVWGNKTDVMAGLSLCDDYREIKAAIGVLETVYYGCLAVGVNFNDDEIRGNLEDGLEPVRNQISVLHMNHLAGGCECEFCAQARELYL